jgi:WD40 repeat protein
LLAHRQIRIFHHSAGVTHAAFSPTGDRIVTSSYDKTAHIWSVLDGSEMADLKGHEDVVERAMFSPDGTRVVTAARDGTARIWNAITGEQLFVLQQSGDFPTAIFNPSGIRVLTAAKGQDAAIWDAPSGKKILSVGGKASSQAIFSPDGRSFAVALGYDGAVGTWSAEDGKPISRWVVPIWTDEVAFSPDGNRMLLSSWNTVRDGALSPVLDAEQDLPWTLRLLAL